MNGPRARAARHRHRGLLVLIAAWAAWAAGAGCAHAPKGADGPKYVWAVAPDSVTIGLWRMDEIVGLVLSDAGPFQLEGIAGVDTRSDYGRIERARSFTSSINSFVIVAYNPAIEAAEGFTVEAWINPTDFGGYEDTPIAGRWTPEVLQSSWLLSIVGRNGAGRLVPGPGDHVNLLRLGGSAGKVMFAFQPEQAGTPRAFFSTRPVELGRWSHVAATYDGRVVRIYLNGQLDAQYASPGRIRASEAPIMIGNSFDPRWLTTFTGDLRVGPSADQTGYYAFVGLIDELRLSNIARPDFPYARHP